jgi:PAS domain S-box-containing protein
MNRPGQKYPPTARSVKGSIVLRVAGLFGALLILAISAMLAIWLYGLPIFGLPGAAEIHLAEARRALELSADSRVRQIETALRERRGDLRLLAESPVLEQALVAASTSAGQAAASLAVRRHFRSLEAAYPDIYEDLRLLSVRSGDVLSAGDAALPAASVADPALLERLTTTGIVEYIETTVHPEAGLLIARQVLARNTDGIPTGQLLGVLLTRVSIKSMLGEFDRVELRSLGDSGSAALFDHQQRLLASFRLSAPTASSAQETLPTAQGMEGSFVERGAGGQAVLATYRFVQLGGSEGWSLVFRRDRDEALHELSQRAWHLFLFGLLFTSFCLIVVVLAARHVTQPIRRLAEVAQRLAGGDLSARVDSQLPAGDHEVAALAATFNAMADRFQSWQTTLAHEVATRTRELQAEKHTAQRYLDVAGVMLLVLDHGGRIALINRKGCEVLGWGERELVGADWFSGFIPAAEQETTRAVYARLMTAQAALPTRNEKTIINAAGEERMIDWRNILLQGDDGAIQGVLSSGEDITERKRIERQLTEQQTQLESIVAQRTADLTAALAAAAVADRAKDAFLANVSHELRTPLNAVVGLAELAHRLGTDARQRDYLDKIANAGKTLGYLINDLLDLSKIAAGRLTFETVTFSLRQLIRRSSSVMSHKAQEKGLELKQAVDDAVPDVLVGDPLRVEQILLNLLSNAIKFTAAGRVDVRIGLHQLEASRVGLDLRVEDTGVGISEEDQQLLFEPFSQADASMSRRFGGSGLGLAICRRLAAMMDGRISVSSRVGQGSTFVARVWLRAGDPGDLPSVAAAADVALPVAYHNARVLVVEDQPINREIVEALLAEVGITPVLVEHGQAALDQLFSAGPAAFDLVLMDIQMPVMDGLTATRALRACREFADLPIIAMTAHTMEHEKEISSAAGMNDHIGKPFETPTFYRLLAKWLPADRQQSAALPMIPRSAPLPVILGVDSAAGLQRFAGNSSRYRHWLGEFAKESASFVASLDRLLADGQRAEAGRAVHAFRGRVGLLGMSELHALSSQLEQAIRSHAGCHELRQQLAQAIDAMVDELQTMLPPPAAALGTAGLRPEGALPATIVALRERLAVADGDCAALIETCLGDPLHRPWSALLQQALAAVQRFDFDAAEHLLRPED